MALPPGFPSDPHLVLNPAQRWLPDPRRPDGSSNEHLLPPLVTQLRQHVQRFRQASYAGASPTSQALLHWWFGEPHLLPNAEGILEEFRYFFAQREAIETIIYLLEVAGVKDKFDLLRFDSSGEVSANFFDETWLRLVIKMATGSGKTKVLSLVIAWCFFHKLYEPASPLARNFLLIAPNIIVLDRLARDFDGLRIFFTDPVLPPNGTAGRPWRDDFQLTVHLQDDVHVCQPTGNLFLTNIHRVYAGNDAIPSPGDDDSRDYFLGNRPTGSALESKIDLGQIVRDIDELVVLNDEAHHIHDAGLAWFQSIADIHNRLLQKGSALSLQLDVSATPRHNNGAVFVQTVADYPLVEAIAQNVVKHPRLPDQASRARLVERPSAIYTEKYADYLDLGVIEWRKAYAEHRKAGKKAILFVMTDDTRNCDDVATYLSETYAELKGAVLVIHTKQNGDISEAATGKAKEELDRLRALANAIDRPESPYKAIVSVLMLKEGWDVRNVTTIVGLRSYSAKSNILPEQTLGRGLRKMYTGGLEEGLSVIGTDAFMEFVESIQAEGVTLERTTMGPGGGGNTLLAIEVDRDSPGKDLNALDIPLPILSPRVVRQPNALAGLDPRAIPFQPLPYLSYTDDELREIVFRDISTGEVSHTTVLDPATVVDYRNVIGYFAQTLCQHTKLFSSQATLYGQLKRFIQHDLFGHSIDLEAANTLRNLAEPPASRTIFDTFTKAINAITVHDRGGAQIIGQLSLLATRPFLVKPQPFLLPSRSVFNRIVGDRALELAFAEFLDSCPDVHSFAKNYLAIGFKLDVAKANGDVSNYYPDFIVKLNSGSVVIVETKGLVDVDVPHKMRRLAQWIADLNALQTEVSYDFVFVDEAGFTNHRPRTFAQLLQSFRDFKTSQR
ncbi:MAG: type III restriction endonuclease subunit R [Cyanobacteria bacterium K_Offshore_surface_m2_239]|nr:type III restriction endonuclease subunit R [Cyanobacteria bacterium K_Offshore_surface_m2_239]